MKRPPSIEKNSRNVYLVKVQTLKMQALKMQHSEIQEQIPFFAIGGLSAQESARVAEHLAVCPSCRALLNEYQFVADELLEQVPPQTAPARVAVRLQNIVEADAKRSGASTRAEAAEKRPRFWDQRIVMPRWVFALGLLTLLLLFGGAAALAFQTRQSTQTSQEMLRLLNANDIRFVTLTSPDAKASAGGYICIQNDNSTALLWLRNMEPLNPEYVYQVWLRDGTTRDNGGTFRADNDGRAIGVVQAPRPLNEYQEIGITVEPVGGSAAPTTPRVIGGQLE